MDKPIISVSGLRGIIGVSLDPTIIMSYVAAFAAQLPVGPIVITRDGRTSGPMIASAVKSALAAVGRDVLYGDIAATPTTGVLVRQQNAAGGVQISASHNPPQYNGIKLFGGDGRVISADVGQEIIDALEQPIAWVDYQSVGSQSTITDTTPDHLNLVLKTVDVDLIRSKNFSAVLDSNHGAGSVMGKRLMDALGVACKLIGDIPNGLFAHPPEPTRDNLENVAKTAVENHVDVVFCQDPDADRVAIIDETGRYIGEEYTLALTLKNRLAKETGPCVINCATSRMSIDIAQQFGCQCHISAVGEANVCDEMNRIGAVYGGEGNGGPIDPRVGYVRDSFVAIAQTLELMASTGKSISQLVNEIPAYAIHKAKSSVARDKLPGIYKKLKSTFSKANSSELDGLRLDWDNRWLLVRPSNTEPIVRIICETGNEESSQTLTRQAVAVIESV